MDKIDTRLSYSSANLLKNCETKYCHHKVWNTPRDPDADDNMDVFNIGKAFHWVLEENGHTLRDLEELLDKAVVEFNVPTSKTMLHAMLLRYLQVHKKSGLEVVVCEQVLSNDEFVGFIDVILKDKDGNWWIADLKTASRFSEITASRLHRDTQLNLYAYFAEKMAPLLQLDYKKFRGARYRVTTKYSNNIKKGETYYEHVKRIAKYVKSYDIVVPKETMIPDKIYEDHLTLHQLSMELRKGRAPKRNLSYCDAYFKPCDFFSQCYGKTYTECKEGVQMIKSVNA